MHWTFFSVRTNCGNMNSRLWSPAYHAIHPPGRKLAGRFNDMGGKKSRCIESHLVKELNIMSNDGRSRRGWDERTITQTRPDRYAVCISCVPARKVWRRTDLCQIWAAGADWPAGRGWAHIGIQSTGYFHREAADDRFVSVRTASRTYADR